MIMKTAVLSLITLLLLTSLSETAFAQCGPVFQDFNTAANGTAGFSGAGSNGSFGLSNNALRYANITGGTYTLTTPVLTLQANAANIDYGFTLAVGNTASVSGITVSVRYVNTSGQVVTSAPAAIPGSSTSGTLTLCNSFAKPSNITTTGASANSYQLIFTFSATGNGNSNSNFSVDNYRTSSTVSMIALPLRFGSLTVKAVGKTALLEWSMETEENVQVYEVQRSGDNKNFATISTVATMANKTYKYTDEIPLSGVTYYRIRSVETGGRSVYSSVAKLKKGAVQSVLTAFPTITQGKVTVRHAAAADVALITVQSTEGRKVRTVLPTPGSEQTTLDFTSFPIGVYVVRFVNGNDSPETVKIIKQ
jgi:hypothetical protein